MEEVHMIKKKPASPHIKIEMTNATLAWDSSHASIQNSPKLTPKMKKSKRAARAKKEKGRQLQHTEHQAVLAEQKGHLLLDSDERPSPEEEEGKHPHPGIHRLQRTLYGIDLEIREVTPHPHPTAMHCSVPRGGPVLTTNKYLLFLVVRSWSFLKHSSDQLPSLKGYSCIQYCKQISPNTPQSSSASWSKDMKPSKWNFLQTNFLSQILGQPRDFRLSNGAA